ncbi:hypothetical protein Hypma_008143 [Hypsizygus marmoreus]|uniref:Uncharacterized protein n=1 Tax=Hypsizygus marmoreus TaxID=39966 RepID=A0A369JS55_HYPMA|nr:hypothetical protein Hypma_008143 [Hypsizygus marmoreus]
MYSDTDSDNETSSSRCPPEPFAAADTASDSDPVNDFLYRPIYSRRSDPINNELLEIRDSSYYKDNPEKNGGDTQRLLAHSEIVFPTTQT